MTVLLLSSLGCCIGAISNLTDNLSHLCKPRKNHTAKCWKRHTAPVQNLYKNLAMIHFLPAFLIVIVPVGVSSINLYTLSPSVMDSQEIKPMALRFYRFTDYCITSFIQSPADFTILHTHQTPPVTLLKEPTHTMTLCQAE